MADYGRTKQEVMTREDALKAMREGKKVTHRFFTPDEWMTIVDGKILLEDGVICPIDEFFHFRSDNLWENGYELFKDKQK